MHVLPKDSSNEIQPSSSQKKDQNKDSLTNELPSKLDKDRERAKKKSIVPLQLSFHAFCDRTYIPGDTFRYVFQKNPAMHWTYVYYRLAMTVAHGVCLVVSVFNVFSPCPPHVRFACITNSSSFHTAWPFYLTSWGMVLNFSQSLIGLALTLKACRSLKTSLRKGSVPPFLQAKNEHRLNTLTGFYWAFNSVSSVLSLMISTVYWSVIYNYSLPATINLMNSLAEHLFNVIWMTVDRCLVAFPVMMFHCVLFLPIGLLYFIASLSYYAAGGLDQFDQKDYLYEFLNWHYPGVAVLSIVLLTLVALLLFVPVELADRFKQKKFRPSQIHEAYENMMKARV